MMTHLGINEERRLIFVRGKAEILTAGWLILVLICFQGFVHAFPGDGKYGFIDETGKIVIERRFDKAGAFSEGLAPVAVGEKWGYIDKKGNEVIDFEFSAVSPFSEGRASVCVRGKRTPGYRCGCINSDGEMVIEPFTGTPFDCTEDLVPFYSRRARRWGYTDEKGDVVLKPRFDTPGFFSEGLASTYLNDKTVFIDKTGKVVFTLDSDEFYEIGDFTEGLAWFVNSDVKYGYMDKTGNVVIAPRFDATSGFFQGLASVEIENKWGFIGKDGGMVIPAEFDQVENFLDGRAAVETDGAWGYIDKTGTVVIPCAYEDARFFFKGLAPVKKGGKWGVIDKDGNVIIEPRFDSPVYFSEGLAAVF